MTKTMNRQKIEKVLLKELKALNDIIDRKILRGLSYSVESRQHKFILAKLSRVRGAADYGWFSRTFTFTY